MVFGTPVKLILIVDALATAATAILPQIFAVLGAVIGFGRVHIARTF
jgi:hypothetical protein